MRFKDKASYDAAVAAGIDTTGGGRGRPLGQGPVKGQQVDPSNVQQVAGTRPPKPSTAPRGPDPKPAPRTSGRPGLSQALSAITGGKPPQIASGAPKKFGGMGMKKGGSVSSASKRADGIATKGKTRGRMV